VLNQEQIEAILPHRPPFLFLDRIETVEYGQSAVGIIEDVARYDYVLRGHFPGYPVFPGALLVEALAEVGAVAALGLEANRGKLAVLTGLDNWRFRRPALPGHAIRLEVALTASRSNFGRGHGRATAGGDLLAEGDLSFAIIARPADWASQPRSG
jgi:3-hydroxyacyl-[acyl-carrier-protein] dehydratase